MNRVAAGAIGALLLAAAPPESRAFVYASGSDQASGDLVGVWIKNNLELILNLGSIDDIQLGVVTSFQVPSDFDGNLVGARFIALGVPNPSLTFQTPDGPSPAGNVALSTNGDPHDALDPNPLKVGDAQAQLDPAGGGVAWLKLLNTIPLATGPGTPVIENDDQRALISTSIAQSYTTNLGQAGDSISGTITPLMVSVPISGDDNYFIDFYKLEVTLTNVAGNFQLGLDVVHPGTFKGDNGISGSSTLSLVNVPEAEPTVAAAAALAALGLLRVFARSRFTS